MSPALAPPARLDAPLRGIGFILVGASVFPVQDVVIKGLSGEYPVLEIVFVRSLVALGLVGWLAWRERNAAAFALGQPWLHALRGILGLLSFTTYYMAIAALPLATVTAVAFAAPLFVTALSALALGEPVDGRRWGAVLVGFVGVLVVLRPGAAAFEPATLLALLSAFCYAASQTMTRQLGRTNSGAIIVLTATFVATVVAGGSGLVGGGGEGAGLHPSLAFLARGWVLPGWGALGRMMLCGLVASVGMYCLTQAYRLAPAGTVAPFEYIMIGWAVLWGYVFWGDVPGPSTVIGVATTVGAGVYVLHHQTRSGGERRREDRAPAS
jgi:drug/metabolite transporter (DMT)-like permease